MEKSDSLKLGIILERRDSDHPWLDHEWVFVGVIPGAPDIDELRVLSEAPGVPESDPASHRTWGRSGGWTTGASQSPPERWGRADSGPSRGT